MALFRNELDLELNEVILLVKLPIGVLCFLFSATLTTTVTSFKALPIGKNIDYFLLYLPLVYKVIINITILGKLINTKLYTLETTPGMINKEDRLLERTKILFNTIFLL